MKKHIYLIGNKPKELYACTDYSNIVDNNKDNIVMRVNRMKSIETGLTGSKTDMLYCDKFAFSWDKEFIEHVIQANPNMLMVIPHHSKQEFANKFEYDFIANKSDKYTGIKIEVIGNSDIDYYVNYIKDSMPAITMTFPNYYPTNVSYALQYLLNKYIYKTNTQGNNTDYDLTLVGIDVHDRVHTYNAPALKPIVHKAFVPYEDKWFNTLEKNNIIKVLD